MQKLLAQPNPKVLTGLRNLCIMRLMLNAGLRVAEMLGLKPQDLDWISGKLMVREGKGAKDRTLWLSEDDLELVRTWREQKSVQSEILFVILQGGRLHDQYIRQVQKGLGHSDLSTTMIYTHIVDEELEEALKVFCRSA